jgi:hypothetical protein
MIKFFDEAEAENEIISLLSNADKIRVAVAYWGKGAVHNLKLKDLKGRDVKIVCDLDGGGSNPSEIEELQTTFGKENVLSCRGLHAKTWITDKCVILGSSNASANGIGWEGAETKGLIEANIVTDGKYIVSRVHDWFNDKVISAAKQIEQQDFRRAKKSWEKRRILRPWQDGSLSEALDSPDAFADRNIEVWIWKQTDLTKQEEGKIAAMRKERENKRIDGYGLSRIKRTPRPGTVIIEFDYDRVRKKFKFVEATRILHDDPIQTVGSGRVALCLPASQEGRAIRKKLTRWESAANSAVPREDGKWFRSLHDFSRYLSQDKVAALGK